MAKEVRILSLPITVCDVGGVSIGGRVRPVREGLGNIKYWKL